MRIGESSSVRLKSIDYIYVLLSSLAGVWQWWCVDYGRDNFLTVALGALMSAPFVLASYAHASLFRTSSTVVARPNWKRIVILWAGMPFSLAIGSATILAQTRIMQAVGFGIDNLPFYSLRLVIGEAAACLVWAICLLAWSWESGSCFSRNRILPLFAILLAGVLSAHGVSNLALKSFHREIYFLLTSVVATTISALILIFLRGKATEVSGSGLASQT
jgi:hypothetical protein